MPESYHDIVRKEIRRVRQLVEGSGLRMTRSIESDGDPPRLLLEFEEVIRKLELSGGVFAPTMRVALTLTTVEGVRKQVYESGGDPMTYIRRWVESQRSAEFRSEEDVTQSMLDKLVAALSSGKVPEFEVERTVRHTPAGVDWPARRLRFKGIEEPLVISCFLSKTSPQPDPGSAMFSLEASREQLEEDDAYDVAPGIPKTLRIVRMWLRDRAAGSDKVPGAIDAEVMQWLRAVGEARRAVIPADASTQLAGAERKWSLDGASGAALADALRNIAAQEVLRNFPRGLDGRWPLSESVLLARCGAAAPRGKRSTWLEVASPARRGDPQVLTLKVSQAHPENNPHRWDLAPWKWDRRKLGDAIRGEFGRPQFRIDRLRPANGVRELSGPLRSQASDEDRIVRSIHLQDQGKFKEAFELFGVQVSMDVLGVLGGRTVRVYHQESTQQENWPRAVWRLLWRAAPWKLPDLLAMDRATVTGKSPPKTSKAPKYRLALLPNQVHARKVSIMVSLQEDGSPSLLLEPTGSNELAPEVLWMRDISVDLERFGL